MQLIWSPDVIQKHWEQCDIYSYKNISKKLW